MADFFLLKLSELGVRVRSAAAEAMAWQEDEVERRIRRLKMSSEKRNRKKDVEDFLSEQIFTDIITTFTQIFFLYPW